MKKKGWKSWREKGRRKKNSREKSWKEGRRKKKVDHPFAKQIELLKSMGFVNEVLNIHLLKTHNGNLEKIVPLLLKIK